MPVDLYYVLEEDGKEGPYTVSELRDLAATGRLTIDHLLLTADEQARIRAGLVVGIFGPALPEPLPVTSPTPDESESSSRRRFLWWAVGVLVLLPVLAFGAIAFSLLAMQKRAAQDKVESEANLKSLVRATMMYTADHDDRLPPLSQGMLAVTVRSYASGHSLANKHPDGMDWTTDDDYSFARLGQVEQPDRTPLIFDPTPRRDGTQLVAFVSGRVVSMKATDFFSLLEAAEKRRAASSAGGPTAENPQMKPAP